jgi:uncharacterized PurR-regulated membrane protein YhhQ (DUF165 family)
MTNQPQPGTVHYSRWFVLITAVFVTCLVTANITAVKLVSIFGRTLPAAIIIFPISYIFGDVLTEVYGYRVVSTRCTRDATQSAANDRQARRVIWLGFLCNLIAVVAIQIPLPTL